jgi:hypothetical protein
LALTFGTLLSSQGADALVLQPSRPSFEAVSPMYTVLRSGRTSGVCPAVSQACDPVCSRSVQREQYTTRGALCRGVRGGVCPPARRPCAQGHRCPSGRLRSRTPGRSTPSSAPSFPHRSRPASEGGCGEARGARGGPTTACRDDGDLPRRLPAASALLVMEPGRGGRPLGGGVPTCGGAPRRRKTSERGGSWVTGSDRRPDRWTPPAPDGVRRRHGVGTGR